jgi:hypothetical protein
VGKRIRERILKRKNGLRAHYRRAKVGSTVKSIFHPMAVVAAFDEGLGDGKAGFGIESNCGGVVGFDAEDDRGITSGASGVNEGGQDGFAEALSARLGGGQQVR